MPVAIFHDLRRTAISNLERAGVSRAVTMKLSGHRPEAICRRYAIAEGVEKLDRLHKAEPRKVVPISQVDCSDMNIFCGYYISLTYYLMFCID